MNRTRVIWSKNGTEEHCPTPYGFVCPSCGGVTASSDLDHVGPVHYSEYATYRSLTLGEWCACFALMLLTIGIVLFKEEPRKMLLGKKVYREAFKDVEIYHFDCIRCGSGWHWRRSDPEGSQVSECLLGSCQTYEAYAQKNAPTKLADSDDPNAAWERARGHYFAEEAIRRSARRK